MSHRSARAHPAPCDAGGVMEFRLGAARQGRTPSPARTSRSPRQRPQRNRSRLRPGPRAAKTVFLIQVLGRDPAPIAQEPKRDPEITIEGLPPGATVKITAKSINAAGSTATTGPVEIKLPG